MAGVGSLAQEVWAGRALTCSRNNLHRKIQTSPCLP
jgi:hypothetical protein